MARARDEIREQRITMEAVVDAYGSSERAMSCHYYLDGKMKVPFKARCRLARPVSVLKVKEEVEILGMAPEEECESEMFVWVGRAGERIAVLWRNCYPCRKIKRPQEAVGDWLLGGAWVRTMSAAKRPIQYVWL
jgi:Calcium binding